MYDVATEQFLNKIQTQGQCHYSKVSQLKMHSKTNHPPPQTSSEHQVEAYILPSDILIIILYITTNDKRQLKTYDCVFGSRATMRNLAAKNVSSAPPYDSYNRI